MAITQAQLDEVRKNLQEKIDAKVSFKVFYWIIGILIGIFTFTCGILVDQLGDIRDKTYEMNGTVSGVSADVFSTKTDIADIRDILNGIDFVPAP